MSAPANPIGSAAVSGVVGTYAGESIGHLQAKGTEKPRRQARAIEAAVNEMNATMKLIGTKLSFSVDSFTKQTVVRVVNSETGELIRQIPSEAMLKISQNIKALLGVLLDQAM